MKFKILLIIFLFLNNNIPPTKGNKPPHIIFILADDLGWNDVSFHGSPQIPTPNIDALGASGIVLNNYRAMHLCTPSRAALMTGKYPIYTGMQHMVILASTPNGLPLKEKLLPQFLKDLGYATHGVGKWHLGYYKKEYIPTNRGFDTFFGYWNGRLDYYAHTYLESVFTVPGITEIWGKDLHDGELIAEGYEDQYATDLFTEKAVKIIKEHNSEKPLFLYIPHLASHAGNYYQPYQAPFEETQKFTYIKDMQRRIYAGMTSKLDESIGKVFQSLHEANMLNNTILIFCSDNGAPVHTLHHEVGSNWPLQGHKLHLSEGGIRVPALIWSPLFNLTEPRISDESMHISDWLPTLYAAAGGNVEDIGFINGTNMWDHLLHGKSSPRNETLLNIDPIENEAALIYGKYKLHLGGSNFSWYGSSGHEELKITSMDEWVWKNGSIVKDILQENRMWLIKEPDTWRFNLSINCGNHNNEKKSINDDEPKLYDLVNDPCEYNNLAEEYPSIVSELFARLQIYNRTQVEPLFRTLDPHGDPRCHNFHFVPWQSEEYKTNCPYF